MKSIRVLYFASIGLLSGLFGWTLMQSGFHFFDALSSSGITTRNMVWLNRFIFEGALIGLGLGMFLQVRVSLWYHYDLVHILSKMFYGALFGMVTGLFSFAVGYFLQNLQI